MTTVSLTVIFRPFQSIVAFWISSPTFLGAYQLIAIAETTYHTERTDLGGQSGRRSALSTDSTEIDYKTVISNFQERSKNTHPNITLNFTY